jgi:hypothetical protein
MLVAILIVLIFCYVILVNINHTLKTILNVLFCIGKKDPPEIFDKYRALTEE